LYLHGGKIGLATFPLSARPSLSYHETPRSFGSLRDGGKRKHAACDLYAPAGSPVLACLDGVVIRGPYLFYNEVYALEIQHADGTVIRYGEIQPRIPLAAKGTHVHEGDIIAYVGLQSSLTVAMLHFEMYAGKWPKASVGKIGIPRTGPLTDLSRPPFMRRIDLIDPTAFLDSCTLQGPAT